MLSKHPIKTSSSALFEGGTPLGVLTHDNARAPCRTHSGRATSSAPDSQAFSRSPNKSFARRSRADLPGYRRKHGAPAPGRPRGLCSRAARNMARRAMALRPRPLVVSGLGLLLSSCPAKQNPLHKPDDGGAADGLDDPQIAGAADGLEFT